MTNVIIINIIIKRSHQQISVESIKSHNMYSKFSNNNIVITVIRQLSLQTLWWKTNVVLTHGITKWKNTTQNVLHL